VSLGFKCVLAFIVVPLDVINNRIRRQIANSMAYSITELLGLAKSQQSVKTSFGKVVCELKAAELDFPSSVPKTGLNRQ
jgi:hypothetical protein